MFSFLLAQPVINTRENKLITIILMSDILNIQPNAGQTPNEDTTFEIEGYDDHINHLEKQNLCL